MNEENVRRIRYSTYYLDMDTYAVIDCDDVFTEITGYTKQDIRTNSMNQWDFLFPEDIDAYQTNVIDNLDSHGEAFVEHRVKRKDGKGVFVFSFGHPFFDNNLLKKVWKVRIIDMSDSNTMHLQLEKAIRTNNKELENYRHAASIDDMTGLLRRNVFEEQVEKLLEKRGRYAFMMIDIDSFKHINDNYGHLTGDRVIGELSKLLCKNVRDVDLVCRMGGDEFAIFLNDINNMNWAAMVADRIIKELQQLQFAEMPGKMVSISIGIKVSDKGMNTNFDKMYGAADAALYQAKKNGKGRYVLA